jgi:glutathione-specific gamma-glutamylcyclotransferase
MGPQDPQKLAEHIYRSKGPSGLNKDYLLSLEKALDELSSESGDGHIKDLANRVRAIEARHSGPDITDLDNDVLNSELKKVSSTDEQEEVQE